jgi:hypothetical protein
VLVINEPVRKSLVAQFSHMKAGAIVVNTVREVAKWNGLHLLKAPNYEAINKGGTMKSLFHPYVRGFLLRAEKRLFLFI